MSSEQDNITIEIEETVSELTTEIVTEPIIEVVTEPIIEVVPEPIIELVPEPTTEVVPESNIDDVIPKNTDYNPYKIKPFYLESSNGYVTYFRFAPHLFVPSKEIQFNVILMNKYYHTVHCNNYIIAGDEYKNWGDDDEYIINLLAQKANLTRISDQEHAKNLDELFPKGP
jgi:hypothetical protein